MTDEKEEKIEVKKSDAEDMILKAREAAERLEKANKELKALLTQQALMKAEDLLGGKSEAGAPDMTEEEREIKAARAMLAGSGYEDSLFPQK